MSFNENTRVKIPAILHLSRLGYEYISLSTSTHDEETNIFTDIFTKSILRINPELDADSVKRVYKGMEKNSKSSSGGTIMSNINQETLKRMLVLMPDEQIISKFNSFISPIFREINNRAKESQTLTELRDWLLPMLMNGQVKVGE